LRVHTLPVIAAHELATALPEFLARHPRITFDFMVTNRSVDLVAENVDVSLRIGPLEDSGLVSRKIVDLSRVVCASPGYLARHGRPAEPADLVRYACLTSSRNPGSASWPFRINGKLTRIDVKGPVSADSAGMLLQLAIEGAGIVRLSEHVVARSIDEGLLEPLLQDAQDPVTYPFFALQPPGRHQAPKVRVCIEFLIERLGSAPWRTAVDARGEVGIDRGRGVEHVEAPVRGVVGAAVVRAYAARRGRTPTKICRGHFELTRRGPCVRKSIASNPSPMSAASEVTSPERGSRK
jgi:hypothetical protein